MLVSRGVFIEGLKSSPIRDYYNFVVTGTICDLVWEYAFPLQQAVHNDLGNMKVHSCTYVAYYPVDSA